MLPFEKVGLKWHEAVLGHMYPQTAGKDTTPVRETLVKATLQDPSFISSLRQEYWKLKEARSTSLLMFLSLKKDEELSDWDEVEEMDLYDLRKALASTSEFEVAQLKELLEVNQKCFDFDKEQFLEDVEWLATRVDRYLPFQEIADWLFDPENDSSCKI